MPIDNGNVILRRRSSSRGRNPKTKFQMTSLIIASMIAGKVTIGAHHAIVSLAQFAAMFAGRRQKNWRVRQCGCRSFLPCACAPLTRTTLSSLIVSSISLSLSRSLALCPFLFLSLPPRYMQLPSRRSADPLAHPHRAETAVQSFVTRPRTRAINVSECSNG